jgi:hypothetical protein
VIKESKKERPQVEKKLCGVWKDVLLVCLFVFASQKKK